MCSTKVSLFCFNPARDAILATSAERDDLRAIWDITENNWEVYTIVNDDRYGSTYFYKNMGDGDWKRFEQFRDMSEDEMEAHCDEWLTHEELGYVEGDSTDDEAEEAGEDEEDDGAEETDEDGDSEEDGEDEND